ncbi:MAG TPA: flavin reductase family protein [Spirochaetales bacterium]|nr:flavin reductase family protein [Spirochaetales bacterium]HRZ64894.1 flavin reductase family protein [Spirochaetia bacterium]
MNYEAVPLEKAYELLNAGGLVLVCTHSDDGRYDLAPVAWNCPLDYEPESRVLFVCDPGHRSYEDLLESGEFVLALPTPEQRELVERTGSASGRDLDKYEAYGIAAHKAEAVDALVPEGVGAWLECRLLRVVIEGSSAIVLGSVLRAMAAPEAWKRRLHYVREGLYYRPGEAL